MLLSTVLTPSLGRSSVPWATSGFFGVVPDQPIAYEVVFEADPSLEPGTQVGLKIGAAVVFHEGSTLLVVANALRLLGYRDRTRGNPLKVGRARVAHA